jgi:hypothetical protein
MIKPDFVRQFCLSFDETDEAPHMEVTSFRVKKKIFATLNEKENRACLKFSVLDQNVFCAFDAGVIYPVPNAWGRQGWTLVNLKKIKKEMLKDAITCAYCGVAPKNLAEKYISENDLEL